MNGTVLVTGGLGYIGSHTCVALAAVGHRFVVIDNLANSSARVVERMAEIVGYQPLFIKGDIRDRALLLSIIQEHDVDAVMHFAGSKAVGESVSMPVAYYRNNVAGTLSLLEAMQDTGVRKLIFSSSATVYAADNVMPLQEGAALGASNPYGRSKLFVEEILRDVHVAAQDWSIVCLRYFNPVGAHPSALIGESPRGTPNNLVPYIAQVAAGRRERLSVFGADYDTIDGTGVRDYVHVQDVAEGHVAALRHLELGPGFLAVNLGTGQGVSVLQMVGEYERVSGRAIAYELVARRPGDLACCWAETGLALRMFGWRARRSLRDMCEDSWRWQQANPDGYA